MAKSPAGFGYRPAPSSFCVQSAEHDSRVPCSTAWLTDGTPSTASCGVGVVVLLAGHLVSRGNVAGSPVTRDLKVPGQPQKDATVPKSWAFAPGGSGCQPHVPTFSHNSIPWNMQPRLLRSKPDLWPGPPLSLLQVCHLQLLQVGAEGQGRPWGVPQCVNWDGLCVCVT